MNFKVDLSAHTSTHDRTALAIHPRAPSTVTECRSSIMKFNLLAWIHASGKWLRRNLLFNRPFDRGHGHIRNAAVVQTLL